MSQLILLQDEPRGPSVLIEIPVTTNGAQRIPLPDISQLRSTVDLKVVLKSLRLITDQVLTNAVLTNYVNAPITELQKMTLTLYAEGWEKGQTIPLLPLNDVESPGTTVPFRRQSTLFNNWVNVDWPKSYIQFANGTVSANASYAILLDCGYQRLDAQGKVIPGPAM